MECGPVFLLALVVMYLAKRWLGVNLSGPTLVDALNAEDVYLAGWMLMLLSLRGMVGTLESGWLPPWLDLRNRLSQCNA